MTERYRPSRNATLQEHLGSPNGERYAVSAGHHCTDKLLPSGDAETRKYVEEYYASRGLHWLKPAAEHRSGEKRTRTGLIVATSNQDVSDAVAGQIDYLRELSGQPLESFSPADIQRTVDEGARTLVTPYLNPTSQEKFLQDLGTEIFGLPGMMTDALNNKAESHALVEEFGSDIFKVVEHSVVESHEIGRVGNQFLMEIVDDYQEKGLLDAYHKADSIGLVLRAADSDGGYGNCIVRLVGDIWTVDAFPDEQFSSSHEALSKAEDFFGKMNTSVESRILMSRLIDEEEAPGLSVVVSNGHVMSLDWNGQIKDRDASCVGTSRYIPKNEHCEALYEEFKDSIVEQYGEFLQFVADKQGISFNDIRAITNVDLMMPSPLEVEYQRLSGQKPHPLIAEFNGRLTEYTDAVIGGAHFNEEEHTPQGLINTVDGGVHTYLRYSTQGADTRDVRAALGEVYKDTEVRNDGLVVVRVAPELPHTDMGIIIYGNKDKGLQTLNKTITKVSGVK